MKIALVLAGIAVISGCANATMSPNYIVRHSEAGDKGDIKEVTVIHSKFHPYATLALGGIGLISGYGSAYGSDKIPASFAGSLAGAVAGLVVDGVLTWLGVYGGATVIYDCPQLRPGHVRTMLSQKDMEIALAALSCHRVGIQPANGEAPTADF